jgi:hypothetical protein
MSNRSGILIVILAIALLVGIFTYYQDRNRRFDWDESSWLKRSYGETSDQPYGTLAVYRLLENTHAGKTFTKIQRSLLRELPLDSSGQSSYVFIGAAMFLDSLANQQLLRFVAQGNTALIASKKMPSSLLQVLYGTGCDGTMPADFEKKEALVANFQVKKSEALDTFRLSYVVQNQAQPYDWLYFGAPFLCAAPDLEIGGYLNDSLVNFIRFKHGKGRFLLMSTPIVFTNYSMLRPGSMSYLLEILAGLQPGNLYWDAASQAPAQDQKEAANPLTYILRQPALAWAWYLLVILSVLWVFFRGKRRQRIIPILAQNENSSYEFIRTIAHLHFKKRNYRGQCGIQMRLFLAQLRERYGFSVMFDPAFQLPKTDEAFFTRLASVSEVPAADIRAIFIQYSNTQQYEPNEMMMLSLHAAMEKFWKAAR